MRICHFNFLMTALKNIWYLKAERANITVSLTILAFFPFCYYSQIYFL